MGFLEYSFTPSEYILLNAEKFSPQDESDQSVPLLIQDGSVNGPRLSRVMLMAALLVNEAENGLEFEVRQKKKLFRPAVHGELYLNPLSPPPNWSAYTLENAVVVATGNLISMKQENTLRNMVHSLLVQDMKKPWSKVIDLVEWGLASSNWLIPVEGDAAAAFSIPFICPQHVRELALSQPAAPVLELLNDCRQRRPDLWQLMSTEIDAAYKDRTLD